MTLSVHMSFVLMSFFVSRYHPERDVSALVAVEYSLQALACLQLLVHVVLSASVKGISVKMLWMIAASRCLRLCSTLFFEGYLPMGDTGVWVCQIADIGSLICVSVLLRYSYREFYSTYEKDVDMLPLCPLLVVCVVGGVCFHGDLDENKVFDSLFTAGLYVACLVPLAQLRMAVAQAIRMQDNPMSLPVHFSVPLVLSTSASYGFWRIAYEEILEPTRHVVRVATVLQPVLACILIVMSTGYGHRAAARVAHRLGLRAPKNVPLLAPLDSAELKQSGSKYSISTPHPLQEHIDFHVKMRALYLLLVGVLVAVAAVKPVHREAVSVDSKGHISPKSMVRQQPPAALEAQSDPQQGASLTSSESTNTNQDEDVDDDADEDEEADEYEEVDDDADEDEDDDEDDDVALIETQQGASTTSKKSANTNQDEDADDDADEDEEEDEDEEVDDDADEDADDDDGDEDDD